MNVTVFFCINSRFRLSQIIPHSDYLNIMPKVLLQRGRGSHQKINFFKHWFSFNCREIISFLKLFVSKILAICLIFRLKCDYLAKSPFHCRLQQPVQNPISDNTNVLWNSISLRRKYSY